MLGPFGLTLFLVVEDIPTNNVYDAERHPRQMHVLGWIRHLQENLSKRLARRKALRLKMAIDPIVEAKKTKTLVESKGVESSSDDRDDGLSRGMTTPATPRRQMIQIILKEMIDPKRSLFFGQQSVHFHLNTTYCGMEKKVSGLEGGQ
jgi:hypothetical protein